MNRSENTLCKIHTLRAIQIGSCLTCKSSSAICETKGCIKHHLESEKIHTSYTVKDVQKIADEYISSNEEKRKILAKMIDDYFQVLKTEVEGLYHEISHAVDNLRFENFLLNEHERKLAQLIVSKRYSQLVCQDVARIIPKMIKCASFEEKQFNHLKDFLGAEKQNLSKNVNSLILNLPYFRDDQNVVAIEKFSEVSDQLLTKVNKKLEFLNFRPKKLRIKYSNSYFIQVMIQYFFELCRVLRSNVFNDQFRSKKYDKKEKFIKHLETNEQLKQVEILEFYCTYLLAKIVGISMNKISKYSLWMQYQTYPTLLTSQYLQATKSLLLSKQSLNRFIQEMVENKNIQMKVIHKDWHF